MLEWLFGKKKQEPQKKQKKKQQPQDKWMYDFMVEFLMSPLWQITILDFVDSKCVVFDNEEENKFEYTIIHNEFKEVMGNLVDGMIEEIGMSQQKLGEIIEKGLESKHKKIFNQLLLADDFLKFKHLMLKRNKVLQQEAFKSLIDSKLKESQVPEKKPQNKNDHQAELLRQSKRIEEQRQKKIEEEEQEQLRKAIELSKIESKQHQAIKALQQKAVDKVEQKSAQKNSPEQKADVKIKPPKLEPLKGSSGTKTSQLSDLPPLKGSLYRPNPPRFEEQFSQPNRQKVEEKKPEVVNPAQQNKLGQLSEQVEEKGQTESLQERKQRLLAQREKIRKQKEEQRKKELDQVALQAKQKQSQPVVRTIVLQEEGFFDEKTASKQPIKGQQGGVSQEELKRRKELMNKIKNRIIDDF